MVFDPISAGISVGTSLLGGIFGQSSANDAAARQAAAQNKQNLANWRYQNEQALRQYKYQKEGVSIERANIEQNLSFQDLMARRQYGYDMQIRAFNYASQQREYMLRQQGALSQLTMNGLTQQLADADLNRWYREQSISLDFEEKSTNMEFRYNQLGQFLDAQQADLVRQQTRGAAQLEQQRNYVNALKAKGEARAKGGMGVTAEKVAGAAIAEAGLTAAAITQQVFNAENTYGLSAKEIGLNLERINDKFYLDKAQIAASRASLQDQAKAMKVTSLFNRMQADLQAIYSIGFEPRLPPAPPAPLPVPRPVLQDPFKPQPAPRPVKLTGGSVNPFVAGLAAAAPSIGSAVTGYFSPQNVAQNTLAGLSSTAAGPTVYSPSTALQLPTMSFR